MTNHSGQQLQSPTDIVDNDNYSIEIKFLQWNIKGLKGTNIIQGIINLIKEEEPEVIVITESTDNVQKIIENEGYKRIHFLKRTYGKVTKFIELYSKQKKVILTPTKRFTSIISTSFIYAGQSYLVHGVHFSSKKSKGANPEVHRKALKQYRLDITQVENDIKFNNPSNNDPLSIIMGDFNCNPYEDAMNNNEGFHALVLSKKLTSKLKKHKFYLNPSLTPMGGLKGKNKIHSPVASYYYEEKDILNPAERYWNMLDGVIISPKLADNFMDGEGLKIITNTTNSNGNHIFYDGNTDTINDTIYSDHLPLTFTLKL